MFVAHGLKRPLDHAIGKKTGKIQVGDLHRELLSHAEMPRFPRNLVTQLAKSRGTSRHDAFTGVGRRTQVQADIARGIEAGFNRRRNESFEEDRCQYIAPLPSAQFWQSSTYTRLNVDYYRNLTESVLNIFYPVTCSCGQKMTGRIATRPYVIRCTECHLTASRLSHTPFVHLKLPLWMLGWTLEQSMLKYPQVLTGAEIRRQLNITEEAALRLKKRIQVFASQQKGAVESLFYGELKKRFIGKSLLEPDTSDINKRVDTPVLGLPIPQSDSVVLFSARERSNKGRKRFRHHGQTASIYAADSLGGHQIGTMVQTTTWKGGPALYESIPNQQIRTLLPIIQRQIPKDVPLFTDMGMEWFKAHNRNHRTVNHNLQSKRGKGKSRRRFQQNGIHTQAAEGRQGALKSAFRSYRYIRPQYSQLYLNEYSFLGALKYFGVEEIAKAAQHKAQPAENAGKAGKAQQTSWCGRPGINVAQKRRDFHEQMRQFLYKPLSLADRMETNPNHRAIKENKAILETLPDSSLRSALSEYQEFWESPTITHRRRREKIYAYTAQKLWEGISANEYADLTQTCAEQGISKRLCHRIIARWAYLGIAEVVDRTRISRESKERIYDLRRLTAELPHILYMATGEKVAETLSIWRSAIKQEYDQNQEKELRRAYERRWINN